jgi:hypothetical protein
VIRNFLRYVPLSPSFALPIRRRTMELCRPPFLLVGIWLARNPFECEEPQCPISRGSVVSCSSLCPIKWTLDPSVQCLPVRCRSLRTLHTLPLHSLRLPPWQESATKAAPLVLSAPCRIAATKGRSVAQLLRARGSYREREGRRLVVSGGNRTTIAFRDRRLSKVLPAPP